jgi:ParB family transcriptional regulator, chromosome partitioning protein
MTTEIAPVLQRIRLAEVKVDQRLRPVSRAGVEAILASVAEIGRIKDPVHVRRDKKGLSLLAGGHRMGAYAALGVEEAEVWVWSGITNDRAKLIEIDDNLAGAEMGPLDTAVFLAARKAVYERLHPETKATTGAELVARRWNTADTMSVVSFAKVTAEKFGVSERHVRRLVEVGEKLSRDELRWLRKAPAPIRLADLQMLAKIGDGHKRSQVCIGLANGAKSAAEAHQAYRRACDGENPVKDPVEEAFIALSKAWKRAPVAAQKRFLMAHAREVWEAQNKGAPLSQFPAPEAAE